MIFFAAIALSYSQVLVPTFSDIDYAGKGIMNQKMDIYVPSGLTSPAPVIIFIHGGGWSGGSKGPGNVPYFQQCYDSGFVCVDINYRLTADSVWPAQIEDCKTAIRFLKANAVTFNIEACRFGVMGESAGAHLASMIGTSAGVRTLEGLHQGFANQSSRVQAVVDLYGPVDFLKEDGHYPASCGTGGLIHEYNSFETALLGIDRLHNYPIIVSTSNPITYITKDDPPFFIIHGADDCTVPPDQSRLLDSALTAAGVQVDTFVIAAGQTHGSPYFKDFIRTALYNDFFLKHLSKPCGASGISETNYQSVAVYPNPAADEIKIETPSPGNYRIEIVNVHGKMVLSTKNLNIINITELHSGIYFLKLISENKIYTQKFIKL